MGKHSNCLLLLVVVHLFIILSSCVSPTLSSNLNQKSSASKSKNHQHQSSSSSSSHNNNMDQLELEILIRIMSHLTEDKAHLTEHPPNPCKPGSPWPGIDCSKVGGPNDTKFLHIIKLNFGSGHPNPPCGRASTFPSDIFALPSLQSVSFHQCFTHTPTTITFPASSSSTTTSLLRQLSLRSNPSLTGPIPPQLSTLRSLTILTLSQNHLTGQIPPQLPTSLTRLDLSYNSLTGPIPATTRLRSLVVLDLSYNSLTGSIPPTLLNSLTLLQKLDLSSNHLAGLIPPATFRNLTSLIFLALSNNNLTSSSHSQTSLLLLHHLPPSLQYLIMDGNPLSSTIPDQLGTQLSKLQEIRLGSTGLRGAIPTSLSRLANLTTLSLENNRLTGGIPPGFARLTRMYYLNLSGNQLAGVVPFDAGFLKRMDRNLDLSGNPGLCIDPRVVGGGGSGGRSVGVCGKRSVNSVMQQQQQQQGQVSGSCGSSSSRSVLFMVVIFRLLICCLT